MLENIRVHLGVMLWLAAMAAVAALSLTVISQILANVPHQLPVGLAIAASTFKAAFWWCSRFGLVQGCPGYLVQVRRCSRRH